MAARLPAEELRKLDEITAQTDYLTKNHIETLDELLSAREAIQNEMETLTGQRRQLQNKIRRASPAEKERLRAEKQAVTAQITACRKKLKLNHGVEQRSVKIQDTMDLVYTNEVQHRQMAQSRIFSEFDVKAQKKIIGYREKLVPSHTRNNQSALMERRVR